MVQLGHLSLSYKYPSLTSVRSTFQGPSYLWYLHARDYVYLITDRSKPPRLYPACLLDAQIMEKVHKAVENRREQLYLFILTAPGLSKIKVHCFEKIKHALAHPHILAQRALMQRQTYILHRHI